MGRSGSADAAAVHGGSGTDLDDPARRSLAGFASVEHYRRSRSALLSYVAVSPARRGHGLARQLLESALGSAMQAAGADGIVAVFAEIHDPRKVAPSSDVIDPAARVRVMDRLGARRVPIRYVQPPLGSGAPSDRLLLIAFPQEGEAGLEAETVAAFLREYYEACDVAADDANLAAMIEQLANGMIALESLADSI